MKGYQRYFPVEDGDSGRLMPFFIALRDGTDEHLDNVRRGNERVLRARLADAKFFYEEDRREPLSSRVEKLKGIMFHEELGNLYAKTERVVKLGEWLCSVLGLGEDIVAILRRAAWLSKADLVTNMVREFTELQGVMGREYALASGEDEEVAEAIFEHYLPRFAGDLLPRTVPGGLVAIADKIDTLAGCFGIGIEPSGSQDPYALRRQALGIVMIASEQGFHFSLSSLIDEALNQFKKGGMLKRGEGTTKAALMDFFKQRLRGVLQDRGARYDLVDAVLEAGFDDIPDTVARGDAMKDFAGSPDFPLMVTGFTRARNIAGVERRGPVNEVLLVEPAERELFSAFLAIRSRIEACISQRDFRGALEAFAGLASTIDKFFTEVLVMCEDVSLRENRLALLSGIAGLMNGIADLSKVVMPG